MGIFSKMRLAFSHPHPREEPRYDFPITGKGVIALFSDCSDFQHRRLAIGGGGTVVTLCYLDGLVDSDFLSMSVVRPLTASSRLSGGAEPRQYIEQILRGAVYSCNASEKKTMTEVAAAIVRGFSVLVFDSENTAVAFETKSSMGRSVAEPVIEKAVKGAKDAFVERLRTNTALLRRHLRTPELKIIRSVVGRQSETEVAVVYLYGIAAPETVSSLLRRLDNIDIDGLMATGNIEEYICSSPRSPFPQIMYTERPDRLGINLLEGRVGIFIDGLPLALMVPGTLPEMMRSPEDKAQHYAVASFLKALRYLALLVALLLPALYVAMAMYHQEMIPLKLLLSVIESKSVVPFSTGVEIMGMLLAFELLQEAGFRLPNPVGETVSIIGALIVGQSAVEAKVVSPIAVIVVAAAGLAGYTTPNQDLSAALRLCRFLLVICALAAGVFGIMAGLVVIVWHLCGLESFGVSYLSPITDGGPWGFFRAVFSAPLRRDKLRPEALNTPNERNQK